MTTWRARTRRKLTVQGWLYLVLSVMGLVVLAGGATTVLLLNRSDRVVNELTAEIGPARVAAYQLQAALRDEETSVRGYLISADRQFLVPYYDGQRVEQESADLLRDLIGQHPDMLADLDAIEETAAAWRSGYAEPVINSVTPGTPALVDPATAERGKVAFDRLRELFSAQNQNLVQAREAAAADLDRVDTWRNVALIIVVVAFLLTAVVLAILVRSAVTRPLEMLAAACRRITDGHFNDRIAQAGPRDIEAIASDVEDMRQRIVEELEVSTTARARLAEQAAELDEQAIELRRSNAELEQFAYVASHDLQEPLRKVASFCQLLEKRYGDQLDERGTEYIRFAVDGAKRMQQLINDLLEFSRVGRISTPAADVDLSECLSSALLNLETAKEESGAEISADPLPVVRGEAPLLTQLLQNLVGNAIKFRAGAPPRIRITAERKDEFWEFACADNGIGIEPEYADRVFLIFQRLHAKEAYGGTGIGLAMCKKIVEYHGGKIWVEESAHGKETEPVEGQDGPGTTIRWTLPVAVAPLQLPTAEPDVAVTR
jgi:signal transduction histidine kinase